MATKSSKPDAKTTLEVARLLSVNKSTVSRIACSHNLGSLIGNLRIFSSAEVRKVQRLLRSNAKPKKNTKKS